MNWVEPWPLLTVRRSLLPSPIVDTEKRRALVDAMRRYDVAGRECWKSWAGETVELEATPGDGRAVAAAWA